MTVKNGVLDMELRPLNPQDGSNQNLPAATQTTPREVSMFERLALDPSVSVDKLERLIAMHERVQATQARAAFNAAFAKMQPEIPEIGEKGRILVKGQLRSTYATLEDIHFSIKPILQRFGFAIRHRTEWPADRTNIIRIVGILSHEHGHSEESTFEAPMDQSEYRTDIQSMGSTVSYGRRYTTLDLLNIATRGADKDGQRADKSATPAPEGYDAWLANIEAVADEGTAALRSAWEQSSLPFRNHLTATKGAVAALKARAAKAGAQ